MTDALAVFAKAAVPGRVKTRLLKRYSAEEAAALHRACVLDLWARLSSRYAGRVWLFCDAEWDEWRRLAGNARFRLQSGGDLGERMRSCFEGLQRAGAERMAILGSDSPTLPLELVAQALEALEEDRDASLAPTEDGGYCLIACRRSSPAMFEGVTWSTASTRAETEAALATAGYRVRRTALWWDVDEPEDVDRLCGEPSLGPELRRFCAERRSR
ncbi:MAG: DUF2064 domain-containing protein [Acidobacteria bacterium]|nr:DUF2064 domain-containing protein [Acidobacteriota bacterium]